MSKHIEAGQTREWMKFGKFPLKIKIVKVHSTTVHAEQLEGPFRGTVSLIDISVIR